MKPTQLTQAKHFIAVIAKNNGTDPGIAERHDAKILELLAPIPVDLARASVENFEHTKRQPLMRQRSFHEIYTRLIEIEKESPNA